MLLAVMTVSATTDKQTQYYMSVGDYFNVSYDKVDKLVDRGIADEDLPVVFKVSQEAKVDFNEVATKRLDGTKWMTIASDYNLNARNFYMIVNGKIESKYYLPIFTKFKIIPKQQWGMISFTDDELIALVNLKFISSQYDYSAFQVMGMKDYGKDFVTISKRVSMAKAKMIKKEMAQRKAVNQTVNQN